jgi:hypothetical protein
VKKRKKKKNFFWFFAFSVVNSIHLEGIVSFFCLLNRPVSPDLVSIKSNVIGLALLYVGVVCCGLGHIHYIRL